MTLKLVPRRKRKNTKKLKGNARLLILLFVILSMISMVSATSDGLYPRIYMLPPPEHIPLVSGSNNQPIAPEMISIVIPQRILHSNKGEKNVVMIDVALPEKELFTSDYNSYTSPYLILAGINENEKVAVLTIPRNMFDYLSQDKNIINLKFEDYYFKFYPDISKIPNITTNKIRSPNINENADYTSFSQNDELLLSPPGWQLNEARTYWYVYLNRSITYVTGKIQPFAYLNIGSGYDLIQEKEIYCALDGYYHGDAVELALEYSDSTENYVVHLLPVIYNENQTFLPGDEGFTGDAITVPPSYFGYSDFSHSFDYYVGLGIGPYLGNIEIWVYDVYSGQWYYYYYFDSTPSYEVDAIYGSSETWYWPHPNSSNSYMAHGFQFWDQWNWEDGVWSRPGDNFVNYGGLICTEEYSDQEVYVRNSVVDWLYQDKTLWTNVQNDGHTV